VIPRGVAQVQSCENSMIVFMSPSRCFSPSLQPSSGTRRVMSHERPNSALVMVAVGVHRTEHDIVIEHRRAVDRADVDVDLATGRRDAQQANDAAWHGAAEQRRNYRLRASALHHHIGPGLLQCRIEIEIHFAAQRLDQLRFAPAPMVIEHVHIELAFGAHQRRQQPDRACARHQQTAGPP
jgi:hypothetical protein